MKKLLITTILILSFAGATHGQIVLDVTGGVSNTQMVINVIEGGTFTAVDTSFNVNILFKDFFVGASEDQGAVLTDSFRPTWNASMGTSGWIGAQGNYADVTSDDLYVGYSFINVGVGTHTLSSGILKTGPDFFGNTGISVNYTSINSSGNAVLINELGSIISAPGTTWSVVPEPSTYALIIGTACLGFVVWKRRRQAKELVE